MKKWVIAVVIGVALLLLSTGAAGNDGIIECGSQRMAPGDVCEETRGGSTVSTRTYEEMKESQEAAARTFHTWGRWALLGGGLVLTVGGIVGIVRVRRRRASAGPQLPQVAVPPSAPPAQYQQQYAQPQYHPSPQYPQHQVPPQYIPPQQPPYPPQDFGPRG